MIDNYNKPGKVRPGKPHIWRVVPGSPIHYSEDGLHARFILVNCDGEFRSFWLYHAERCRPAIEARLAGRTHYQGEPCPDCGGTDYFANPLDWNTKEMFGALRFAKGECFACKKDPSLRSAERRETAAAFKGFAEVLTETREALAVVKTCLMVDCLRMALHYGRQSGGVRSTDATRIEWLRLAANTADTTQH